MKYPYLLYSPNIALAPIFKVEGEPFALDLSVGNELLLQIDIKDQTAFQAILERRMQPAHSWGLGGYLERRDTLLRDYPQMVEEQRYYHLGLDIVVPKGSELHAPLDAVVHRTGYEEGDGNYGGYALLKHESDRFQTFYSFYGHLSPQSIPVKGTQIKAGDVFARIGDFHENGNWYHHTHLQIITQKGLEQGFLHKGYCAEEELRAINDLCPDPLLLFRI
jgi:hypothetical protein